MEKALRKHLPGGEFQDVSPQRSRAMGAIKGRGNKTTERRLRLALVRNGISGWKVNPSGIKGKPDFVFHEYKVVVFVEGCFWHGCAMSGHFPKKNSSFWRAKIERNVERDRETTQHLESIGYRVLRFWEHDLQLDLKGAILRIQEECRSN